MIFMSNDDIISCFSVFQTTACTLVTVTCLNSDCGYVRSSTLVDKDFNDTFTLATMHAGMTVSQVQTVLLDLNFASSTAGSRPTCVDLDSKPNVERRKQLRKQITILGQQQQAAVLQSVVDNQSIKQVIGQIDGNYPTRGRNSRVALVSLLLEWEIDNCKQLKLVGQVVVKRLKQDKAALQATAENAAEDDDETEADAAEADADFDAAAEEFEGIEEIWVSCNAQQMETEGVEYLLKNQVKKLIDAGKQLSIATDGDNKIANQLKELGIRQLRDVAHIKKNLTRNVEALVKGNNFWGDDFKG